MKQIFVETAEEKFMFDLDKVLLIDRTASGCTIYFSDKSSFDTIVPYDTLIDLVKAESYEDPF